MNWTTKVFFLFVFLSFFACKEDDPVNPFDNIDNGNPIDSSGIELEPASIEGLHAAVFKKTCANSGCHDGTFEPDYRTIESTYNTLVYQPIIKNDPQGSFEFRVVPGNADASQLIARLTYDIDGNSGVMPLALEPDSDWDQTSDAHIQNVRLWIQNGARDILGNQPVLNNNGLPQMLGVAAKASGQWLAREDGGLGALRVPKSETSLELYFAFTDDDTAPNQLGNNKIRFSMDQNGFEGETEQNLQILNNPEVQPGFEGGQENYYHKISINPQDYAAVEETIFFRAYIKDSANPVTEIPSDGGAFYIKNYFSFTIIE